MKKLFAILFATLVVLLPVIYVTGMLVFLYIIQDDDYLRNILDAMLILGFLFNVAFCVLCTKSDRKFLTKCNIWSFSTNLLLYAAEIIYFIVLMAMSSDVGPSPDMGVGLGIALYIFFCIPHWIIYCFTRIFAAINCAFALRDVCSTAVKVLHLILHLIPLLDLVSAVWVYCRVRREPATRLSAQGDIIEAL